MAAPVTYSDVTTVRNTSGVQMYFDFLGPRGGTLNAGQDTCVPGDLFTMHWRNPNKRRSLEYALKHGLITVLETPYTVVFDSVVGKVDAVGASSGSIVPVDPDYGSYYGSAPNP